MSRSSFFRSCHRESYNQLFGAFYLNPPVYKFQKLSYLPHHLLLLLSQAKFWASVYALSLILKYGVDLTQELTNQKVLATALKNLSVRAFIRQVNPQNKATSEIVELRQKSKEQLGRSIGF